MWNVEERGFLPDSDPIAFLPISDIRNTELVHTWENLSHILPYYLKEDCLREELIYDLRKASHSYYHGCIDNLGGPSAHERAFLLLGYFTTAYVNSPEGKKKYKLPKEIAVPFARVAHLVGRQPVLDYTSFVLYNWKIKDSSNQFTKDNIEIMQTLTESADEQAILIALVEMEFTACEFINNLSNPYTVAEKLAKINRILQKTWQDISPDFLHHWSDILADYQDLKYEQWRQDKLTFPCDIFLQTPVLLILYRYLDIEFRNEVLKKRTEEIYQMHVPQSHRYFLRNVAEIRSRSRESDYFKKGYNNCLNELIKLRNHLLFRNRDTELGAVATNELNGHLL